MAHRNETNANPDQPKTSAPAPAAPESTGPATATKERPKTSPPRMDKLPSFRVLLHNDDVNEIGYVLETVVELTPLNKDEAVQATIEAHKAGVSLLLLTHKERAELYRDQFESKFLTVTIEPAE